MHIDVIDDFSSIDDLRDQWDAVYDADPDAQFFLSSTWIFHWMVSALSNGILLAARPEPEGSDYVAFFPLRFRTWMKKGGGFYSVLDMACQGIADYNGAICRPEYDAEVFPAFAEQIKREANIMTQAVGLILDGPQAEEILQSGAADLIASSDADVFLHPRSDRGL